MKIQGNVFTYIAGLVLVSGGLLVLLKHLSNKQTVPPAVQQAVTQKAAQNYAVANSLYGGFNDYNFAGLALESSNSSMPLGFHLNNVL